MSTTEIVVCCIVGSIIGIPLFILFVYFVSRMIIDLFVPRRKPKCIEKRDYVSCLDALKNCTEKLPDSMYPSQANNFIENRFTELSRHLDNTITAFGNEYGASNLLQKIQEEYFALSKSLHDEWRDYYASLSVISLPQGGYKKISRINHELNLFILKAVTMFIEAQNDLRKYPNIVNNNNRKIFIVHGKNHDVRDQVSELLKSKAFEPIVLQGEANKGQFLLEKFLTAATTVSFAIVIMTADDNVLSYGKNDDIKRARQNVILELGYFISRLGKERILILQDDEIENPSDINGLLYEPIHSDGKWKDRILQELYCIGYENIDESTEEKK